VQVRAGIAPCSGVGSGQARRPSKPCSRRRRWPPISTGYLGGLVRILVQKKRSIPTTLGGKKRSASFSNPAGLNFAPAMLLWSERFGCCALKPAADRQIRSLMAKLVNR
jgi:hypothetical protein